MMNTEELKRLAEAATPGPWAYTKDSKDFPVNGYVTVRDCIFSVCVLPYVGIRADNRVTANGFFIAAANPAAILAMIAEIDSLRDLKQQRDELLAALKSAKRAIGDHYAPDDCYATGPLTGDAFLDLVQCPACAFLEMHAAVIAKCEAQS